MKQLPLRTTKYRLLEKGFKDWLSTLGYSKHTVYGLPYQAREFLHWLEQQGITGVTTITGSNAKDFMEYFRNRKNQRRSGGLSNAHINGQVDCLNKFFDYLNATGHTDVRVNLTRVKDALTTEPVVLSQAEIGLLYKACDDTHIGIRDRAMLAVYYGCGLRKSEGLYLELPDVLFERRLLYVRKTKNNYERYVPMSRGVMTDIENYIYGSRPLLIARTNNENTLFISERGGRMNPESMVKRLQAIREKTGCPDLQQKSFGLHALRHSIATHLLQKGMDIENIAIFLGHRTLDSTQRYTHLVNELH